MWLLSFLAASHQEYFFVNALVNCVWTVIMLAWLFRFGCRDRGVWLGVLVLLGFHLHTNWDVLAVMLMTAAYPFWVRSLDDKHSKYESFLCGFFLGLGAAAKLFPAFLVPFLVAAFIVRKCRHGAFALCSGSVLGFAIPNSVFAITGAVLRDSFWSWTRVFEFHSGRLPDFGTLWRWLSVLTGASNVTITGIADRVFPWISGCAFLFLLARVLRHKLDPWRAGAAMLCVVLMSAKVHSPQYALWFIPFLVIHPVAARVLVLYVFSDVALLGFSYQWIAHTGARSMNGWGWAFATTVLTRFAALGLMASQWISHYPGKHARD
jgi:uncharacterized membrane protein